MSRFFIGLSRADRRVVFGVLAVVVCLPLFTPPLVRARPSGTTMDFYRALERTIASEGPLILSVNFGPQTVAEMEPILMAVMHKVFAAKKKAIFLTFLPEAAATLRGYLGQMERQYDLAYGEDYVFLGYASAYWMAINNMGTSIEGFFHEDDRGTGLSDIPLMRGVKNYDDVAGVVDIASNTMPRFWITYAVAPFKIDFLMATTAVQATDYYPYLQTGQVKGLLAGGRTAAEMESLLLDDGIIQRAGDGTRALGAQSMALLAIIAFIAVGNIGYFLDRREKRGPR